MALQKIEEGFNWRSPSLPWGGSLGTSVVIKPDPAQTAKSWKANGGKSRAEWEEHAKRMGLFPDDINKGWDCLSGVSQPDDNLKAQAKKPQKPVYSPSRFGEAVSKLKAVLGEATSWWGYSVPNLFMLNMPGSPGPGFGFHTKSAEEVWKVAKQVADEDPKQQTVYILSQAINRANVLTTELTPEDAKMLEIAINWYLSGKAGGMETPTPPSNGNRIGGAPGGPFRSTGALGAP